MKQTRCPARSRRPLLVGAVLVSAVLAGCADTAPKDPAATRTAGSVTAQPSQPLRIVGLGDSYMSAANAQGRSFMQLFGTQLGARLTRPVEVAVFAQGDSTSARVVTDLRDDPGVRAAVAKADIVVISVGSNDVDPFGIFPKGTCAPGQAKTSCLKAYAPELTRNYDALFTELESITRSHPVAVRVTSVDNPFIGMPDAPTPTFGRTFFAQVAEAETDAIFAVARDHGARGVDYLHVFGGPRGLDDPAKYLADDHAHPGDLGIQTIADLLTEMGTSR